eukprot:TRINITY_DN5640_c0_g1::TRINITY_DN5640_c0_g1_i1::g.12142::m.12142 TRINITY_DN5640_c0_g1::TRINITY_DN5640_c0_g1_i1::g.12142  ORF type:complete len:103 (+),score=-9.45,MRP/PF09387.5/0.081,DUF2800/PF10926.3/0.12 TRINITY_DN5640_c0_g1_i1:389-697(+)
MASLKVSMVWLSMPPAFHIHNTFPVYSQPRARSLTASHQEANFYLLDRHREQEKLPCSQVPRKVWSSFQDPSGKNSEVVVLCRMCWEYLCLWPQRNPAATPC